MLSIDPDTHFLKVLTMVASLYQVTDTFMIYPVVSKLTLFLPSIDSMYYTNKKITKNLLEYLH